MSSTLTTDNVPAALAMEWFDIEPRTLYEWVRKGLIRAARKGRLRVFDEAALLDRAVNHWPAPAGMPAWEHRAYRKKRLEEFVEKVNAARVNEAPQSRPAGNNLPGVDPDLVAEVERLKERLKAKEREDRERWEAISARLDRFERGHTDIILHHGKEAA